jgi:inorganic pyrophosphatase
VEKNMIDSNMTGPESKRLADCHEVTAVIEIPAMTSVKYEFDKATGRMVVDRFLEVPMQYPCHYGYLPETLAGDGDELDILVLTPSPLQTGVTIRCRPIGVLNMTDEKGEDAKILAVPGDKLTRDYQSIQTIEDLQARQPSLLNALRHFFEHYKDLDDGKWVEVQEGWGSPQAARELILASKQKFQEQFAIA